MSGLLAKSALTLAAALSTAASAAPRVEIWIDIPHPGQHHRHQQPRHHGHPNHHHGRVPYYQPQYQPKPPTVKQLCDNTLLRGARVHEYLPLTGVGFIERQDYACKVSFNNQGTARVTGAYDTYKNPTSFINAKNIAYRQEENKAAQYYATQPQFHFRLQLP